MRQGLAGGCIIGLLRAWLHEGGFLGAAGSGPARESWACPVLGFCMIVNSVSEVVGVSIGC